jgi:5'-3' exonuclease
MGIPYFFYHICRKYDTNKIVTNVSAICEKVDYLYFDYNSLIHPCAHGVVEEHTHVLDDGTKVLDTTEEMLEEEISRACITYTRYLIDLVKPKELVTIAVDGVAPRAKVNQQRERRFKSTIIQKKLWDSNKITPGTKFMHNLHERLLAFAKDYTHDTGIPVTISGANEPGEGEHKIMHFMSSLKAPKTHCIYGLDADLIMLSLLNKWGDNIILFRDNAKYDMDAEKRFECLPIQQLKHGIIRDILENKQVKQLVENNRLNPQNFIVDYIVSCFFLGNDFLPHLPNLLTKERGVHLVLRAYIDTFLACRKFLVTQSDSGEMSLNKDVFMTLMNTIGRNEDYFFKNQFSVYKEGGRNTIKDIDTIEGNDAVHVYETDYIKFNESNYKQRYYTYYGHTSHVRDIVQAYMQGIQWTLGYYNGHRHQNWTWYYPHVFAPFASDAARCQFTQCSFPLTSPLTSIEQLILVLPKESLLPILKSLNETLYKDVSLKLQLASVRRHFPEQLFLDGVHKTYLWECKAYLEPFSEHVLKFLSCKSV